MRIFPLTLMLAFACGSTLLAQTSFPKSVLKNGNFTKDLSGWTFSGTAAHRRIVQSSVSGVKSNALQFVHISTSAPAQLSQVVKLPAKIAWFRAFVSATVPPGAQVTVTAELQDSTYTTFLRKSYGFRNFGKKQVLWQAVMNSLPYRTIKAGTYNLNLQFQISTQGIQTSTFQLDRVILMPVVLPITSLTSVKATPQAPTTLFSLGSPNSIMIQYVSLRRGPRPFLVPGCGKGQIELDPGSMFLLRVGRVYGSGRLDTKISSVPPAMRGIPFYAQTLQLDATTLKCSLGSSAWLVI